MAKAWVLELHRLRCKLCPPQICDLACLAAVFSVTHVLVCISQDGLENEMREQEGEINESSAEMCKKMGPLFVSCNQLWRPQ